MTKTNEMIKNVNWATFSKFCHNLRLAGKSWKEVEQITAKLMNEGDENGNKWVLV